MCGETLFPYFPCPFLSAKLHILRIDDHDEVTTVFIGAESRLMLPPKDRGYLIGQTADKLVPGTVQWVESGGAAAAAQVRCCEAEEVSSL